MKPLSERRRRSARETFGNCQRRYQAEYLLDVDMSSGATRRGSAFHRAKELYIQHLWSTRESSDHELAREALTAALIEMPLPFAEELDTRNLWQRFTERFELPLAQYYDVETALSCFGTVLRFDLVLVPSSDVLLVEDSKTNWQIPSEATLRDAYQTRFYLAAARRLFPGFTHYRMAYVFERFNQRIEIELTPAELDETEDSIADTDAAMDDAESRGLFPATGGARCGTCMATCPLVDDDQRTPARFLRPQDASETVGRLAAYYRVQNTLRDALRGFIDASGVDCLESKGIRWAYRPAERTIYKAEPVLEALKAHGFAAEAEKVYLSGSAVRKFVTSKRKFSAVEDAIKRLGTTSIRSEFGPKVTSMEDDIPTQEDEA